VKLNLLEATSLKPDYLKLNPTASWPTLALTERSSSIQPSSAEYLDEVEPELTSRDTRRARPHAALMHFIDEMPAAAVPCPPSNLASCRAFRR